ncbi:MAG TPA: AIR synthase related protein, partial [Candidatus Dormibacteraeota bacterium]|nr:AIR synthase related protein [Candidatus Dormibacteraeota bacterium]
TYDHQVQNNTVILPGGDAAVLRIKGTDRGIAVTTDGNGRYCYLDPRAGAAIAVAEAARNIVATGARPAAVSDCLNFGNPEKPEVFWELKESIEGMADACRQMDLPVVSGNVSLYNDTSGVSIYPSPVVGMVGVIDDIDKRVSAGFREEGDAVLLVGQTQDDLGGSEFLKTCVGRVAGRPPALDMEVEKRAHEAILNAADERLLQSCHDLSDGGLAVAVAESAFIGGIGVACDSVDRLGLDLTVALFSESQSRFLVSCRPRDVGAFESLCKRQQVPAQRIGTVGGELIALGERVSLPLAEARELWENALR